MSMESSLALAERPKSNEELLELLAALKESRRQHDEALIAAFWRQHPRWNFFKTLPYAARLLDLGAGSGGLGFWKAWGTPDRSDLRLLGVDFQRGEFANLYEDWEAVNLDSGLPAFEGKDIDACIATHVIEHLQDPGRVISWLAQRIAPGGRVYFEWPNPMTAKLPTRQDMFDRGIDVVVSNFHDDGTHQDVIEPSFVTGLLESAGMTIAESGVVDTGAVGKELFVRANNREDRTMGFWSISGWCVYVIAEKPLPAGAE